MFPVWYWSRNGYYYFSDDDGYFPERADYANTASGSLSTGGTADPPGQVYVHGTVTGGLALGGSADTLFRPEGNFFGGYFPEYYYIQRTFPNDYWPEEIGTTSKEASGGLSTGGGATESFDLSPIDATGGLSVAGGAGVSTPATQREAEGGASVGGSAEFHFISAPAGGLALGGSSGVFLPDAEPETGWFPTHYHSERHYPADWFPEPNLTGSYLYEWMPVGGLGTGGTADVQLEQGAIEASGGLSTGGTAGELLVYSTEASGGLSLGGEADAGEDVIGNVAEGGVSVGGTATVSFAHEIAASGGLSVSGEAGFNETVHAFTADGGLAVHGAVDYRVGDTPWVYSAGGQVDLAGSAPFTVDYNEEASGGLQLGGSLGVDRFQLESSGGIELGGEADVVTPNDISLSGSAHIEWTQHREAEGGISANGFMRWYATLYEVQCTGSESYVVVGYETDRSGRAHEVRQVCAAPDKKGIHWGDHWFVCPVNGTSHLISEGVKIGGQYYSKDAAWDIMAERSKR